MSELRPHLLRVGPLLRGAAAACALAVGAIAVGQTAKQPGAMDRESPLPKQVQGLEIEERVGETLPMDVEFTNAQGKKVKLGDYFKDGKPAVIGLVYYKCPVVCSVVMEKMAECFERLDYTIGTDFNALLFSFDSTETADEAAQVKRGFLAGYAKPVTPAVEAGWEFHVGPADSSRRLADAVGFKYRALDNGQFSHPGAIFVITPQGKVSRYFYGYSYPARDMKLSLMDASQGKLVKTIGDRFMSYCFKYDPTKGGYSLVAVRVMQVGGVLSALLLGGFIGMLFVGDRLRRRSGRGSDAAAERAVVGGLGS